jgi:hypothetical protein
MNGLPASGLADLAGVTEPEAGLPPAHVGVAARPVVAPGRRLLRPHRQFRRCGGRCGAEAALGCP